MLFSQEENKEFKSQHNIDLEGSKFAGRNVEAKKNRGHYTYQGMILENFMLYHELPKSSRTIKQEMATEIYKMFIEPSSDGLRSTFMKRDDEGQLSEMTEKEACTKIIKALKDQKFVFKKANERRSADEISAASGMVSLQEVVISKGDSDVSSLDSNTLWQDSVQSGEARSTKKRWLF